MTRRFKNRKTESSDGNDARRRPTNDPKQTVEVEESLGVEVFPVKSVVLLPNFLQLLLVSLLRSGWTIKIQ